MGGDFIILEKPIEIPPTKGDLSLVVDGDLQSWQIVLPKGVRKNHTRTPIERI